MVKQLKLTPGPHMSSILVETLRNFCLEMINLDGGSGGSMATATLLETKNIKETCNTSTSHYLIVLES